MQRTTALLGVMAALSACGTTGTTAETESSKLFFAYSAPPIASIGSDGMPVAGPLPQPHPATAAEAGAALPVPAVVGAIPPQVPLAYDFMTDPTLLSFLASTETGQTGAEELKVSKDGTPILERQKKLAIIDLRELRSALEKAGRVHGLSD